MPSDKTGTFTMQKIVEKHVALVEALKEWIEVHVHEPIKIEDVAHKAGYSKWHLQRVFQDVTAETLGSYIRNRKLALAAEELKNTRYSVCFISDRYGFDSQQTFTRVFSRVFNQSPRAFRKSNARM